MGTFNFQVPGSDKSFELKGPPNLTFEQAKAIFDKQLNTGSLVGLKPGDVLSASTQAAAGLDSARAVLTQAQSGVVGALGEGIKGAAGAIGQVNAAFAQAGGAIKGAVTNIAGVSAAAGAATAGLAPSLNQINNTVTSSIQTINKTLSTVPLTNPINAVDFSKTLPALDKIGTMAETQVTAALSSAKNIVNQASTAVSNIKGVGDFGLNVSQLEKAGIVKPGTSTLVNNTTNTVSSVLKSPAVFTGKDGINNLKDLTSNPQIQSTIQQGLMATGVAALAVSGIPTKVLNPQALAGVASMAAKSVDQAKAYLNNLPIPNDPFGSIKQQFDKTLKDGAFAVNLADTKLPTAWKAETIPVPAARTVNRETVDAASSRVIGNEKVPTLNYGSPPPSNEQALITDMQSKINEVSKLVATFVEKNAIVSQNISVLENKEQITSDEWNAVVAQLNAKRTSFKSTGALDKIVDLKLLRNRTRVPAVITATQEEYKLYDNELNEFLSVDSSLGQRVAKLKAKIVDLTA